MLDIYHSLAWVRLLSLHIEIEWRLVQNNSLEFSLLSFSY
jgi:hypothetical protein